MEYLEYVLYCIGIIFAVGIIYVIGYFRGRSKIKNDILKVAVGHVSLAKRQGGEFVFLCRMTEFDKIEAIPGTTKTMGEWYYILKSLDI